MNKVPASLTLLSIVDGLDCTTCDVGEGSVSFYTYATGTRHYRCHACGEVTYVLEGDDHA